MTFSSQLIVKTAIETLETEAQTIADLTNYIDNQFVNIVQEISRCTGRVVITGIGKSALIGRKIVATLNSTGTPSIFMHAADALHGDLGMIQQQDMIICLSKSGETAEIKALIPLLQQLGAHLIAMTARPHSHLAQQADFILHTPVPREAEPNNLAPTASTTAQMAMGDALASCLLVAKGFAPADFAKYHPAGALGKRLYLRVKDICHHQDRPMVKTTATLRQTIMEMTTRRLGCAVVVDEGENIQGIITDGDLRRMLEREGDVSHFTAVDIMSRHPRSISQNELAAKALDLMSDWSISQLIVVDEDQYIGVVHLHDLVKVGL